MAQTDLDKIAQNEEKAARLVRLSRRVRKDDHYSVHGYSKFVRFMRLTLPLCALAILVILYLRSGLEEQVIKPVEEAATASTSQLQERSISRNELLNPKFESVGKQSQPYEITAKRAVQGAVNKDLIMLSDIMNMIKL